MQELEEALEQIDSTYVTYNNLNDILANSEEDTPINATLLGGQQSDAFLLRSEKDTQTFKPKSHSSSTTEYGGASTSNYGHVKLRDNLTASSYTSAEALSSYQGKVLNDKIETLEASDLKNSLRIKIGRWNQGDGEDNTQISIQKGSGNGIYAKIYCDDPTFSISGRHVFINLNNKVYTRTTDSTGKTGKLEINLDVGSYPVTVFTKGSGDEMYPAIDMKVLNVTQT